MVWKDEHLHIFYSFLFVLYLLVYVESGCAILGGVLRQSVCRIGVEIIILMFKVKIHRGCFFTCFHFYFLSHLCFNTVIYINSWHVLRHSFSLLLGWALISFWKNFGVYGQPEKAHSQVCTFILLVSSYCTIFRNRIKSYFLSRFVCYSTFVLGWFDRDLLIDRARFGIRYWNCDCSCWLRV